MKTKLTTSLINSLKPRERPYEVWDTDIKGFYLVVTPKGTKNYYFFYRHEGAKRKFRIGRDGNITVAQARDTAKRRAGEVTDEVDIHAERKKRRSKGKAHTLKSFIEGPYIEWREVHRKRASGTLHTFEKHFFPIFGNTKLKDITAWNLEKWKTAQIKAGNKPTTVNRYIAELKSALSKAVEWEEIEDNPLRKVKPAKIDHSPNVRYLSNDEETRLRQALTGRDKKTKVERANANKWREARGYTLYPDLFSQTYTDHLTPMVLLSINTGMRRGEVFHLCWEDINFSTETLTIHGGKAKSGHTRHIPLNNEALTTLENWGKKPKGLVFPNKDGNPLDNIKSSWGTLLKEANIKDFRWHDLRHHFASRLVMVGVDLNTVRELLGHSDIKTTLRYAHLAPEHKAEAVKLLDR